MTQYYAQRASAGLIIAEATMAIENNSAFWMEPDSNTFYTQGSIGYTDYPFLAD